MRKKNTSIGQTERLSYNNKLTDYKKLQDNLKPLVHFLYNLYYGKSYTFNISNPW